MSFEYLFDPVVRYYLSDLYLLFLGEENGLVGGIVSFRVMMTLEELGGWRKGVGSL